MNVRNYLPLYKRVAPSSPSDTTSHEYRRRRSRRTYFLVLERKRLNKMCDYYLRYKLFLTDKQIAEQIYNKLYCEETTNPKILKIRNSIRFHLNEELNDCRSSKIIYTYLKNYRQRSYHRWVISNEFELLFQCWWFIDGFVFCFQSTNNSYSIKRIYGEISTPTSTSPYQ